MSDYDVIVVGAGNAAQAAAMSALENGAKRVAILEKAHEEMRGGNTHWSGGILRIAFDDSRELAPFLPGITIDISAYSSKGRSFCESPSAIIFTSSFFKCNFN